MQPLDWILVGVCLLLVLAIGAYTQRYVKGVADFLSAGRVARRYLLAVGRGEMSAGAVVFVSAFEVMSHSGFALAWWGWLTGPIGLVLAIFGFVVYRYRETRAMTLGQFFEIRYSRKFRLFTGLVGFLAGLANFGIIPAIGARAMVYFLDFPEKLHLLGFSVPTFLLLMIGFLSINVFITATGGILTIIMTNCAEGIISQVLFLFLIFGLLHMFTWTEISQVLSHQPAGQSLLNPFDTANIHDFNLTYVAVGLFLGIYGTMAWQNQSAYNSAPLNGHEARMGGLLGGLRGAAKGAAMTLLGVCAYTYLHHPAFAAGAAQVHETVSRITNPQIQKQMTMPVAVTQILPPGLRGAFCAVLLLGVFGGDSSHLHSWGSLLIQDFLLPLRRKPLSPEHHLFLLRCSIVGVALFALLFGAVYSQTEYIQMWFAVTQSIYIGGAGAVIIGGLYWKKGTTAGAWSAMITGSVLSTTGILVKEFDPNLPLNGVHMAFFAMVAAFTVYVVVSLATCRQDFNMERMLHRGRYAKIEIALGDPPAPVIHRKLTWGKLIGFDQNFTLGDKWIAGGLFAQSMTFFLIMIVGTTWNLLAPWPLAVWSEFWHVVAIGYPVVLAVITSIWFTWGSVGDSLKLFHQLRTAKINPLDNGAVADHHNLDEGRLTDASLPAEKSAAEGAAGSGARALRQESGSRRL
ncbi:MAG: sodium:proline symporter [Verrucomicrobiota bacterium]